MDNLTSLSLSTGSYPTNSKFVKPAPHLTDLNVINNHKQDGTNSETLSIDLSTFPAVQNLFIYRVRVSSTEVIQLENVQSFYAMKCEVNLIQISIFEHLSDVYLENVIFLGGQLESFIGRMDNLRSVALDYSGIPNTKFDLNTLSRSVTVLRGMSLYGLELQMSSPVVFGKLKSMALQESVFNVNTDDKFNETFPNLIHLTITRCPISYSILKNMLTISSLKTVSIVRADSNNTENHDLFTESGVPRFVKYFKLERSNSSSTGWSYIPNSNELQGYRFRDIVLQIYVIVLITICGFGLLGNILSAVVLTRNNMRSSTSCILLGLTLCDGILLITYAGSILYYGIKLILVFLNSSIPSYEPYFIFGLKVTESFVKKLDELQYRVLFPLNRIGKFT